jgi:hypothetical protein
MRTLFAILFTGVSFLAVCQDVETKAAKGIDMNVYSTFRVDRGEVVTLSDQRVNEDTLFHHIKQAITRELIGRGYKSVEDSTAQLVVSYVGEFVVRTDIENLGPLGEQPVSDPSQVDASRTWSREYKEGSLAIDIHDPSRRKTVWQSRSTVEVTSISDARAINGVVAKAFRKFPVKKKK